jgi:hypothetical protein
MFLHAPVGGKKDPKTQRVKRRRPPASCDGRQVCWSLGEEEVAAKRLACVLVCCALSALAKLCLQPNGDPLNLFLSPLAQREPRGTLGSVAS